MQKFMNEIAKPISPQAIEVLLNLAPGKMPLSQVV